MKIFLVFLVVIFVAACEKIQGDPSQEKWTENVKLQNGEVLQVKREERHGQGEAGTSGGPLTYSSLEFEYRGKHYRWESGNVAPDLIEIDPLGRPVIAGGIVYEWAWRQRGKPCDKLVVQYADAGQWIQIPSWEIPVSPRFNLAADAESGRKGVSVADQDWKGPTHGKFDFYKEKCMAQKENFDVHQ